MQRQHLKNLYDCINRIAQSHEAKGKNRSHWFYSDEEFEQVKTNTQNNIL